MRFLALNHWRKLAVGIQVYSEKDVMVAVVSGETLCNKGMTAALYNGITPECHSIQASG